jgi:hypothetical protein
LEEAMKMEKAAQSLELPKNAVRDFVISVPLMLLVLLGYLCAGQIWGLAPQWGYIGLGALGWVVALNLRLPFIPLVKKLGQEKGGTFMAALAGPCEEVVRLAAVLIFGRSFPVALAIGTGWAAIEVLFAIINGAIRLVVLSKDDEKAQQAKEILAAQGLLREIPFAWILGAWERLFASGIHLGFTLMVAANPWLVVILTPLHSLVDLSIPKLSKRSIWLVEGIVTVVGAAALLLGLLAMGHLYW